MKLKKWIERRTWLAFGLYRPALPYRVWMLVSPQQGDQAFSVIVGSRGFWVERAVPFNKRKKTTCPSA